VNYANVPASIGLIVSKRYATLKELQEDYGVQDMYDFLEIIMVNNHNQQVISKKPD